VARSLASHSRLRGRLPESSAVSEVCRAWRPRTWAAFVTMRFWALSVPRC
jgi:hypothetical protein